MNFVPQEKENIILTLFFIRIKKNQNRQNNKTYQNNRKKKKMKKKNKNKINFLRVLVRFPQFRKCNLSSKIMSNFKEEAACSLNNYNKNLLLINNNWQKINKTRIC